MALPLRSMGIAIACASLLGTLFVSAAFADDAADRIVAERLAEYLRSARTVISQISGPDQRPDQGRQGPDRRRVIAEASAIFKTQTGEDPAAVDPTSREGRLLRAQMDAILEVMAENKGTIDAPDVGFKGFIPAIFARLVNEKFEQNVGEEAEIKVTAPEDLVRNRKARPDAWEKAVLIDKFAAADWPKGQGLQRSGHGRRP